MATQHVEPSHEHAAHHPQESWFRHYMLSTDHKIICFQYMFTGMALAVVAGVLLVRVPHADGLPRHERVRAGGCVTPAQYNMLVTNHGAIMIFWVAMPVLIAAFGNYLIPLMIGADDMVFPKINRLSYQIFLLSAVVLFCSFFVPRRRLRGRLDDLPAAAGEGRVQPDGDGLVGVPRRGRARVRRVPARRHQLRHHGDERARAGHELQRHPDRGLDDRDRLDPVHGVGGAADRGRDHAAVRPAARHRVLRPEPRRRPDPVAAPVLVLRTPRGLRGAAAGDRHHRRDHHGLLAQEAVRLQDRAQHGDRHRRAVVHGLGAPPVRRRHRSAHGEHLHGHDADHLDPDRRDDVRLHRDAVRRLDHARDADAVGAVVHRRRS